MTMTRADPSRRLRLPWRTPLPFRFGVTRTEDQHSWAVRVDGCRPFGRTELRHRQRPVPRARGRAADKGPGRRPGGHSAAIPRQPRPGFPAGTPAARAGEPRIPAAFRATRRRRIVGISGSGRTRPRAEQSRFRRAPPPAPVRRASFPASAEFPGRPARPFRPAPDRCRRPGTDPGRTAREPYGTACHRVRPEQERPASRRHPIGSRRDPTRYGQLLGRPSTVSSRRRHNRGPATIHF